MELGITVVGDGEMSKPSYVSYVSQRLTGLVSILLMVILTMMTSSHLQYHIRHIYLSEAHRVGFDADCIDGNHNDVSYVYCDSGFSFVGHKI